MGFWLIAAGLAALIALALLAALLRGRMASAPTATYDLQVYRDQLREVEKDLARGVISENEAERVRIEVSRRILEADKDAQDAPKSERAPRWLSLTVAGAIAAVMLVGSLALYPYLGAPGYPDMPLAQRKALADIARETRESQAEAEARLPVSPPMDVDPRYAKLVEELRRVVAERPTDPQGMAMLAQSEAGLGNYRAAYAAQAKLIGLKADNATAEDFAALGELMILAVDGYVSPEAEAALNQTLERDRTNGTALFYAGVLYARTGRPDLAFNIWRSLLEQSQPSDPWVPVIENGIGELAMLAGVDYTPPAAALPGPSAADMQAAGDMSDDDRQAMIRGMVERLSDRLATDGGTADEWARLIGALGVLGETDRARGIWAEAQTVFAQHPADLATVLAAAQKAGVAE
ncbi:c-type cytochrome biogenesis protein CcmI [Actibacterium sp.]|uniref:c-type cytochrome biogenesis protein CcmI n=1 Tax=Actibacterium sp. TaxID=1872125 RepID=UPI0035659730